MEAYDQKCALTWLLNALDGVQASPRAASFLTDWAREHKGLYGVEMPDTGDDASPFSPFGRPQPDSQAFVIDLASLAQAEAEALAEAEAEAAREDESADDSPDESEEEPAPAAKSARKSGSRKSHAKPAESEEKDSGHTSPEDAPAGAADDADDDGEDLSPKYTPEEKIELLRAAISVRLDQLKGSKPSNVERKLRLLCKTVGLTKLEGEILGVVLRYKLFPTTEDLIDGLSLLSGGRRLLRGEPKLISRLLGSTVKRIEQAFDPDSPLMRSGLLSIGGEGEFDTLNRMTLAMFAASPTEDSLLRFIVGPKAPASIGWEAFDYASDERDAALSLLENALASEERGVHLFIYGPAGAGKTELARALGEKLAQSSGAELFALGEADDWGNQPAPDERLGALQTAYEVLKRRDNTLLMVDEVDEIFFDDHTGTEFRGRVRGSPIYFHRLLSNAPVPTIWIVRNLSALEPVFVRHASYAIEMELPAPAKRKAIWQRELKARKLKLSKQDLEELVAGYEVTPGQIAAIARSASLRGGGVKVLREVADALTKVMRAGTPAPVGKATHGEFNREIVNADADLASLTDRLTGAMRKKPFSMLLYGPAGCGKSEYVRHLAKQLGLELLQKRASDILSKWVGESEAQIALAFEEARRRNAFLVFDEADSLLGSRKQAGHTWEVSQVNEMLTWMESHPLPFAATTNLMSWLDEAALRRFTFKVGFKHLEDEQLEIAYRHFFRREPPERVRSIPELTPGDFAVARRKGEILGVLEDDEELIKLLTEESDVKPDQRNIIGFRRKDMRKRRTSARASSEYDQE